MYLASLQTRNFDGLYLTSELGASTLKRRDGRCVGARSTPDDRTTHTHEVKALKKNPSVSFVSQNASQ